MPWLWLCEPVRPPELVPVVLEPVRPLVRPEDPVPVVLEPVRPLVRPDDPVPVRPEPVPELPVRPLSPVRVES